MPVQLLFFFFFSLSSFQLLFSCPPLHSISSTRLLLSRSSSIDHLSAICGPWQITMGKKRLLSQSQAKDNTYKMDT